MFFQNPLISRSNIYYRYIIKLYIVFIVILCHHMASQFDSTKILKNSFYSLQMHLFFFIFNIL